MSVNSVIGIIRKDGTVECIGCYFDGYILGVGNMLINHYMDQDRIEQILKLGNLKALDENIEPPVGVPHTFDDPAPGTTVSLKRDRGEDDVDARVFKDIKKFEDNFNDGWDEYAYLFDERMQQWYCNLTDKFDAENMVELSKAIEIETPKYQEYLMKYS